MHPRHSGPPGLLVLALLATHLAAQQPSAATAPAAAALATATRPATVAIDRPHDTQPTLWLRGEQYKASIDGDGFTYVPFLGADAERSHPVTFRLQSVQLAGEDLDIRCQGVAAVGDRITVSRTACAETYDAAWRHVKQSFHFDQLARRGELEVVLATTTDLAVGLVGGGLSFSHERGSVTYRDLVVYDAAGHSVTLPIVWRDGAVHLVVPADFVAAATLPLVVDPLITSTLLATVPDVRMQPDVAWNETAQEHLAVWMVPFSATDWDVAAVRCDAFMNPLAASFWIDFTAQNWVGPRVACKTLEGMFLVVAQVDQSGQAATSIRGRRYEAIGTQRVLWSQFDIQNPIAPLNLPGNSFSPDVGADPWLFNPAHFVVVFEYRPPGGNGDIAYRLINADGTFPPGSLNSLNSGAYDDRAPSISKSAGQGVYGIVWAQYANGGVGGDIVAAEIDYSGALRVPPFYLDSSANDDSRPRISTPADIPGLRQFLVTWQRNWDSFSNSGALHAAAMTTNPNQVLVNRWNLSALLGIPATTMAYEPVVDSDGLRFAVAHSETATAAPGTGRVDVFVSTLAIDGTQLRVHEGRVPLQPSGPQTFSPSIASRFGGGLADSRSYGIVCGSNAISVLGRLYNGHQAGSFWSPRGGGCGNLQLTYGGYPVFGHSVDLQVAGSDPFRAILLGFPQPLAPIAGCPGCTIGVQNAVTVSSPYTWELPYVPAFVGLTLSAQGFSIGGSGTCFGAIALTGVLDFTLR